MCPSSSRPRPSWAEIAHGLTLVTRNVADYRDVPGLALASPEQLEASQT